MRAFSSTLHTMLFSLAVKGSHLSSEDSLPGIILPHPSLDRSIHMCWSHVIEFAKILVTYHLGYYNGIFVPSFHM